MVSPGARKARARLAQAGVSGGAVQRNRYVLIGVVLLGIAIVGVAAVVVAGSWWGLTAAPLFVAMLVCLARARASVQPFFATAEARGYLREGAWLLLAIAFGLGGLVVVSLAT